MKKVLFATAFFVMLAALAAQAFDMTPRNAPAHQLEREDLTITTAKGVASIVHVEIAAAPADQERGLMFRQSVPDGTGMLFVFPTEEEQEFWMKNTLVPLDMLFIDSHGVIDHIHENAKPNDLTPIPSEGSARAVLELPGGTVAKLGIKPGDKVNDRNYFRKYR